MKTKFNKYILAILAFALILSGCNKSDDAVSTLENNKQGILTFETIEEFNSTLSKVSSMSKTERLTWEKEHGFKSFGSICDEFYETINPEKFKNLEEIKSFVTVNNDKIQLIKDENEELSCVIQEYDNPKRFFMNEKKMYIINKKVYRSFSNGDIISVDIKDIAILINAQSIGDISNEKTKILYTLEKKKVKIATSAGEQYFERTEKRSIGSKNYKTIVKVETVTLFWSSLGIPRLPEESPISYTMYYNIQNQSQFIVWWYENADTKYAPFSYKISNGVEDFTNRYINPNYLYTGSDSFIKYDDEIDGYTGEYPYHEPHQSNASPYIISFDGYVYSTFTRNGTKMTITINLKFPY